MLPWNVVKGYLAMGQPADAMIYPACIPTPPGLDVCHCGRLGLVRWELKILVIPRNIQPALRPPSEHSSNYYYNSDSKVVELAGGGVLSLDLLSHG